MSHAPIVPIMYCQLVLAIVHMYLCNLGDLRPGIAHNTEMYLCT